MTSQTQRLLLMTARCADWVCFVPPCVRRCVYDVCACVRASIPARPYPPPVFRVHVCVDPACVQPLRWLLSSPSRSGFNQSVITSRRRTRRVRQNKHTRRPVRLKGKEGRDPKTEDRWSYASRLQVPLAPPRLSSHCRTTPRCQ